VWSVGREPQEGWCPWIASLGYTELFAIETLWRPSGGSVPFTGDGINRVPPWPGAPDEVQERRARQHVLVARREKALKRDPGRVRPARVERFWRAEEVRAQPQERRRDETSPSWLQVKEDVERVRNPEDGRCRRLEPAGSYGRLLLSNAVGDQTPGEVHSDCAPGAVDG